MTAKHIYIVTVKLKQNPKNFFSLSHHDPHNKIENECPFSDWCTDSTGAHHTFLMLGLETSDIERQMKQRHPGKHITRIEKARFL